MVAKIVRHPCKKDPKRVPNLQNYPNYPYHVIIIIIIILITIHIK